MQENEIWGKGLNLFISGNQIESWKGYEWNTL